MNRKEKTILVSIVVNLVLVGLKYGLAVWSGSLALRAGVWHSMGDVFISLFVLGGLFAGRWEAKRRRRVGLVENVVALVVSGFIFYIAYEIFREVIMVREQPDLRNAWIVTVGALLTVAITYFLSRYKDYVGRATESPSLIASGYHSRMDMYASMLVVVSLAAAALGLGALDRVAAVAIILFVLKAGWEIASSAIKAILSGGLLNLEEEGVAQVRRHTRRFVFFGIGAVIIGTLLSGLYTIQPDERGIVRRFGRVTRNSGPGLHYRWPLASRLDRVTDEQVRQVQTGVTSVLTGDTNLIEISLSVQYTVSDSEAFLFNVADPEQLVLQEAEAAIRQAVAERSVDDLLTTGRVSIQEKTRTLTQELLDEHETGLRVTNIQLLAVTPPSAVAEAFRDVSSAREDKSTYINEALALQNEIVPAARGEATRRIEAAQAEKIRKIDLATGEAAGFVSQLAAYRDAPQVTRTRLYLETLEQVLPLANKFIVDPDVQTGGTELWLTNKEPRR